jgi:DNA-binding MarR family transcriptional regulator
MREECGSFAEKLAGLFSEIVFKTMTVAPLRDQEALDVTVSQLQALAWVAERGGSSVGEIAEGLGVTHPAVIKLVHRLQEKGWVTRSLCDRDHRQAAISATPAGRDLVNRVRAVRGERLARVLERMEAADRQALIRGLEAFVTAARGERALDWLCCSCQALLPTDCVDFPAVRERYIAAPDG